MTFDQWWNNITLAEQKVIGRNNAQFVWQSAVQSTDAVWKEAVISELVCCHIYNKEHDNNPRKAIQDAISWNCQVSLDPQVSSDAQALIDRGVAAEREACCSGDIVNAANISGGDHPHQVVEKYQAAIRARGQG